jgi:predicted phosphoribosyltransferase
MTRTRGSIRRAPRRVFRDRREAGRVLADLLGAYRGREGVVVLGLARGGIPVAWEVAAALGVPMDACIVRKLGAPGHEEFAMGALASGGRVVVNDDVLRALRVSPQQLRDVAEREGRELIRREAAYRGGRQPIDVAGKTVILVDDGLATGASMFAAVQALREAEPAQIVIAVPAAPESTCREFAGLVDDMVCATMPTPFLAVGESFWDFKQVSDEEVREYLATPTRRPPRRGARVFRSAVRGRCVCDGGCSTSTRLSSDASAVDDVLLRPGARETARRTPRRKAPSLATVCVSSTHGVLHHGARDRELWALAPRTLDSSPREGAFLASIYG